MKVTKTRLKEIILEELAAVQEAAGDGSGTGVSKETRADQKRKAAIACNSKEGKQWDPKELTGPGLFSDKLKRACKDKVKEGHGEEEYTPMMPPKAIKKKGIDVPLTKLADGAEAARAAVEAMYSPSSREYARAMMDIDMAEDQGALNEALPRGYGEEVITPASVTGELWNLAAKVQALGEDFYHDADSLIGWIEGFMKRHAIAQQYGLEEGELE